MNAKRQRQTPRTKGGKRAENKPKTKRKSRPKKRAPARTDARDQATRLVAAMAANPDAPDDQPITVNWNPYGITYGDCRRIWRHIMAIATGELEGDDETIKCAIAAARVATTMVTQCQRDPKNNPAREAEQTTSDEQPPDEPQGDLRMIGDQPLILKLP